MIQKIIYLTFVLLFAGGAFGQSIYEHGFLPGKKFPFYSTIDKYDFTGLKLCIELVDDRPKLNLKKIQCSDIDLTNTSELESPNCIYKVREYLDTLFHQAGATTNFVSFDTVLVNLEAIDARLIGFGYIRVHGLCQMTFKYHNLTKTYCIDITDNDKHSPLSPNALVTRKTATRIMASVAMREVIEQFFNDLKQMQESIN